MSNPLEYLLALRRGKVKNPLQSLEMAMNNHQLVLILHRCSNHLGDGNHQEKQAKSAAQHEYQVPLDAITKAMHLDSLPI